MLIPILLSLGVAGYLIATRRTDMKDAIRVGDTVHIMPSFAIPGLTPQQAGLLGVRVDFVDQANVRGPVVQAGANLASLQQLPTALGPFNFPKTDVITIVRNGRVIA